MKLKQIIGTLIWLLINAFLGAASASAQPTPALEPSIVPAVQVSWPTTANKAYQVLTSTTVSGDWIPVGQLIEGTGGQVGSFLIATNGQRFFRIQETTRAGLTWLQGTWQGPGCQTGPGLKLGDFTVRLSADGINRQFSAVLSASPGSCTMNLSLISYTDTQAEFHSSVQSGPCFEATVIVTIVNPTSLAFHFITANPAGTGGGLLTKQ
jgi:hypothetical protein